jgi:hypothetical protein
MDQFYSPPGGEGGVNRELVLWPPTCPKCCANSTALRYDAVLDRIGCTCGRCKYDWRVNPRDMPEPAAIPLAAEGDGDKVEKETKPMDVVARTHRILDKAGVKDDAWIDARVMALLSDCAALRAERDKAIEARERHWQNYQGCVGNGLQLGHKLSAAIAERDALREKIDKGHRGYVRPCTHGLLVVEVPKCWSLDSRVRVLLEGE